MLFVDENEREYTIETQFSSAYGFTPIFCTSINADPGGLEWFKGEINMGVVWALGILYD